MSMHRPSSLTPPSSLNSLIHTRRCTWGSALTQGIFPPAQETRGSPQYQRPKTSTKCYSLSSCFFCTLLHTYTLANRARHGQCALASPRPSFTRLSRPEVEMTLYRSTGDLTTLCLSGPARLRYNPHTTMCWPSSPPLRAKRARTSETYWRPSKNGIRCCKSLSVGSFIQPCIGIALS